MLRLKNKMRNRITIALSAFVLFGCNERTSQIPKEFLENTGLNETNSKAVKIGSWESEYIIVSDEFKIPELRSIFKHQIVDKNKIKTLQEKVISASPSFVFSGEEIFLRGTPNEFLRFEVVYTADKTFFFGYR